MTGRACEHRTDVETVRLRGRDIRVEHVGPVLEESRRLETLREIEAGLYDIFIKYSEESKA